MPAKLRNKGFTLIELLIVIAILGLLAVVIIVALNPLENLNKTRDAGRLNTVGQLGHALLAFSTNHNSTFPSTSGCLAPGATSGATWMQCLVNSGDIPSTVSSVNSADAECTHGGSAVLAVNGWCYDGVVSGTNTTQSIVYARLISGTQNSKCGDTTKNTAWALFSSADGKGGVVCTANGTAPVEPTAAGAPFTFVQ